MVRPNTALHYIPDPSFNEDDLLRYVNDEFNKIAAAFKQIVDAGLDLPTLVVDGDITLSGYERLILVSTLATIALPSAAGLTGRELNIVRTGTAEVTIDPDGIETISGDLTIELTDQWDSIVIVSDGSNWVRCS